MYPSSGSKYEQSGIWTTVTNSPNGYSLYLTMLDNNTCLRNADNGYVDTSTPSNYVLSSTNCDPSAGSPPYVPANNQIIAGNPNSTLIPNVWGYSTDSGATYLTVQPVNSDPSNPNVSTRIKTTSVANSPTGDNTTITFGARINSTLAPGEYQGQLVLTALANKPAAPTITNSTPITGTAGTVITITGTNFDTAYEVTVGGTACTTATIDSSTQITCEVPVGTPGATVNIVVYTWGGDTGATGNGRFTYQGPATDIDQACTSGYAAAGQTLPPAAQGIVVDIDANMIPIKYTGSSTTPQWQTTTTTNAGNAWYNYAGKQWANAVTVTPGSLATYQGTDSVVINEADVLGYWVYVPRYRYQVMRCNGSDPAITTPTPFNIQFENKAGTGYQKAFPSTNGDWATHPAFTFGTTELNGIWVGKYEASSPTDTTSTTLANTQVTNNNVFIKPNQYALKSQNVSTQFKTARAMSVVPLAEQQNLKMDAGNSILNGVGSLTIPQNTQNLSSAANTRMAKNVDWGAIAYLASSAYGVGVTTSTTYGAVQINSNNSAYGVTGCGPNADQSTATYSGGITCTPSDSVNRSYYTALGMLASTTNNVYGIYDLNGGSLEYTIANYSNYSGGNCPSNAANFSGFTGSCSSGTPNPVTTTNTPTAIDWNTPGFEDKYYDIYTVTAYANCTFAQCGGHALYETIVNASTGWNGNNASFVNSITQWFARGGANGNGARSGVFTAYTNYTSSPYSNVGFRPLTNAF